MKIKIGKTYETGSGAWVRIDSASNGMDWPFRGTVLKGDGNLLVEGGTEAYRLGGKWLGGIDLPEDLKAEIPDK